MVNLRCRPGDLARVIYSSNPALVGRIVLVECWHDETNDRWETTVFGAPTLGLTLHTKRPIITTKYVFRDTSLLPLRGDDVDHENEVPEVDHA
ncbi:TPA: hypothetical protein QDB26_005331 [Burkholderia vietnamiensis]|nr:hypothetical protein [Burkholderia vietnamiensis]HDR9216541.1 hypothetical protein [Burkholderia vietnamiensis]